MKVTAEKNEKVANMIFASIYPLYWNMLEKNGRTKEEFHQVLEWFTGYDEHKLQALIDEKASYKSFFQGASVHPNAHMIKGVVCGYRIEEIEDEFELYRQCRQMEKLIDELAKGRKMEKRNLWIIKNENCAEETSKTNIPGRLNYLINRLFVLCAMDFGEGLDLTLAG